MYSVYLIRTVTGEVGARLDVMSGSWSIELNKEESGSIKAKKSDLARINRDWWTPSIGGVLFTYTDPDGIERPIAGGPITGWSGETSEDLTLDWKGIRHIFVNRIITTDLSFKGLSLGTIAWRVVQNGMDDKPAGGLPIVHGQPEETVEDNANHQRTYEAWNLSNNGIDKRLTELSEVINGPAIMFRPEWVDEYKTRVQWSVVHGTERNIWIEQAHHLDFDTTMPQSPFSDMSVTSDASAIVNRVWATGSGEGQDVARTKAEDLSSLSRWYPFQEKVITDSDQSEVSKLFQKASGELMTSRQMLDQLTMSFRANNRKHPLGTFFVGDEADVWLKGWFSIPDGRHPMRIISMSGGLDGKVTLDFQKSYWD